MPEYCYPLRVRFCEIDEYGFAWHGHYLAWFEAARIEMLREVDLTPARLLELGYLVPVLEVEITCRKPIRNDAELTILCSIEPAEKALIAFGYRILDERSGEICATARTSHIVMNRRESMLYILPDEIREPLERLTSKYPALESTLRREARPR